MDPHVQAKMELRTQLRHDRELAFTPQSWLHVMQSSEIQGALVVASYISYDFEPQTVDINAALIREGKTLLIPRTLPDRDIEWVAWDGSQSNLRKKGKRLEPVGGRFLDESLINVLIVPALHIDVVGNRIGQGGGSYDRALSRSSGWKLGLVGTAELGSKILPVEAHDQKVDAAATPSMLLRFNQGGADHL